MSKTIAKVQYKLSTLHGEIALQAGQTNKVKAKGGEAYSIRKRLEGAVDDDLANDVVAQRSAADLQLDYADGTRLILEDYFNECRSGADCAVTLAGDAPQGWQLTASSAEGAVLADGSTLLYAHGSPQALGSMTLSNPGLEQSLAGLQGEWITYVPQSSFGASGWVTGGLLGLGGLAAGGGSATAAAGSPVVQNFVKLAFVGGPALAGNDLSIEVYRADGKTLIGIGKLGADGSVTIDAKDYMGVVVVKLINGGNAADYLDEATGTGKDLGTQLYSMGLITEPNSIISLNVNVLTTLAYAKAQEALGGSLDKPVPLTASQIEQAAKAISGIFQVGDVLHTSVLATNGGHYNPDDGLSAGEKYGSILAAISGAEKMGDKTVQQVLDDLLSGIKIDGQGQAHIDKQTQDQLIAGGHEAGSGSVSGIVDTFAPVFTSGIAAKAVDENSGEGQVVYTAQASDASGVSYSLGGADAAALRIDAATGKVTLAGNPDYETKSSYSFTVIATDAAGNHSEQVVTLGINDLPEVRSVAITGAEGAQRDTLNAGDVVSITVTMDNATFVDTTNGIPRLALNIGGQTVYADYVSGSGGTALVFSYTIEAHQTDANGISIAADSLSLNGGTLKDAAGNAAALGHDAVVDNGHYLVDTTTPVIASVAITAAEGAQNDTLNAGDVISITVTMSEVTHVTGTPRLALNIGGEIVYADYVSGSGGTALVFSYTIEAHQTDANGISIAADSLSLNGGTLKDAAGNAATLSHDAVADNGHYLVDTTPPTATLSLPSTQVMLEALGKIDGTDKDPQITALPDGSYVVVWSGDANGLSGSPNTLSNVFAQKFSATGQPIGPIQLLDTTGNNGDRNEVPQVMALGQDGSYVVTWSGQHANDWNTYVRKFDSNGLAGLLQTFEPGAPNSNPKMAELADGRFILTWSGQDSDSSIYLQLFDSSATPILPEPTVLPAVPGSVQDYAKGQQITALDNGGFAIAFYGRDANNNLGIVVGACDSTGEPKGLGTLLHGTGNPPRDTTPQITPVSNDGSFVVVWTGTNAQNNSSIFVQQFGANGQAESSGIQELHIPGSTAEQNIDAQVARLPNGNYVVVWQGPSGLTPVSSDTSIYVQRFNAGTGLAEGERVKLDASGQIGDMAEDAMPQITVLPDGSYVVAWYGVNGSKPDTNIFVQKFNADGTTTGHVPQKLEVPDQLMGTNQTPQVQAVGKDGSFVVTWSGLDNGSGHSLGSDFSIFVQQFGPNGKPLQAEGVSVRSSEAGTAYLVQDGVAITDEASLKAAVTQGLAKSITVSANTTIALGIDGLRDGSYKLYSVDKAGNVSAPSANGIVVDNNPPELTSATTAQVDENIGTDHLVYTATSKDASAVSYSLTGTDVLKFRIDKTTGEVRLIENPDYETKASYSFTVVATDATGKSSQQEVSLTIKDVDEDPPVFTSGATATAIDENSGAAQMVYKANATDASAVRYSLAGADATKFRIDAKTGAVTLIDNPDYETQSGYAFTVVAIDALGNQSEQKVTLNINDVDDTPPVADLVFAPGLVQLEMPGRTDSNDRDQRVTALGNHGDYAVAWISADAQNNDKILVQRFQADGSLVGAPVQLGTGYSNTLMQITALGNDGSYVVTWQGWVQDEQRIFMQRFNADGSQAGSQESLGEGTLNTTPQITALGSDGAFVLTWNGTDGTVLMQRFDANGQPTGAMEQLDAPGISNGLGSSPQITDLGVNGQFVVVWQGQDTMPYGNDQSIFVQRFDTSGKLGAPVHLEPSGVTNGLDFKPIIAALGGGAFAVTWYGSNGNQDRVFVQRFDTQGQPAGTPVQLEVPGVSSGEGSNPSLEALGGGAFAVAWQEKIGNDPHAFVQRFDASGNKVGEALTLDVPGNPGAYGSEPKIVALGQDGAFAVTWTGSSAADGLCVYVQSFTRAGTPTGTISQLKAPGVLQGMNLEPQITALGHDGAFVVTWKGDDNSSVNSPDSSIFVQRFNADGTPFEPSRIYSPNGSVQVQSNEAGAVYLVHDSVKVAKLVDITGTADALWNSVAVKAGTSTALTLAGLADGSYHTYAVDSAGNLSSRGASAITVDSTGPVGLTVAITSATGSHNGWLVAGDKVLMSMTLDEVGMVGGVPQLALDIGGQTRYANYVSGSGSKTLVFEYQIQPGDESLQPGAKYFSGIKVPANALQFGSGASLMDSLGNLSKGSSATGGSTVHLVDAKAPLFDTAQTTMLTQMENRNHGMRVYDTAPKNEREIVSFRLEGADADRFELRSISSEKGYVMVYWKDTQDQNYETGHSYDLVLVATDQAGNVARKTLDVQIQDAKGPTVQDIHLTGATGQDNGLINTVGDTVTAAVTFSAAVKVGPNGVPQLKLQIGGQTVYADYVSGSGSEQLVFQYKIVAGCNDADGISVGADALWIPNNGAALYGDITGLDGTPADLNHGSVADDIRYQVDTKGPEFQGGSTATATAVLENSSITDPIYTAQAKNDANDRGGVVSYRLKAEAWTHYNQFVIDADTGEVRFAPGVKPDYELAGGLHAYSFVVEALDKFGNISEQRVTLPVIDVDDTGPRFESAQFGSSQAQKIGSKYWLHAGDVLTISIFADEVTYIAGSPQLELDMSKEVPYGTDSHGNPYYISRPSGTIRADYVSGSGTTRLNFQYTVQPGDLQESTFSSFELVAGSLKDAVGNDARLNIYHIDSGYNLRIDAIAPVHVSGTQASADAVADDSAVGSLIYTASAIDEQSAVTYSLKAGDDAAMFRIDSVTGKVTLASSLDYGHNASHEYQFTVVAKDVLGNASEQKVTLHVTDHTAPTLVTSTPVDDAGNVAAGSSIVLTFSENVLAGSGSIHIVNDDDPSKSLLIDVTDSSQVIISGATVTINPGSDLMAAAKYHVEVESGAFKDAAGNGYAGISDSTTLNFTVKAAPQSHTLMVYSGGVYLDNDGNGALSAGDTALLIKGAMGWEYTQAATGTSGFHGVSGDVATINGLQDGSGHAINLADDAWTVKFFSAVAPTLDLAGLGANDTMHIIMDGRTLDSNGAMGLFSEPGQLHRDGDNQWEVSGASGDFLETRHAYHDLDSDELRWDALLKVQVDAGGVHATYNTPFTEDNPGRHDLAVHVGPSFDLSHLTFFVPAM